MIGVQIDGTHRKILLLVFLGGDIALVEAGVDRHADRRVLFKRGDPRFWIEDTSLLKGRNVCTDQHTRSFADEFHFHNLVRKLLDL